MDFGTWHQTVCEQLLGGPDVSSQRTSSVQPLNNCFLEAFLNQIRLPDHLSEDGQGSERHVEWRLQDHDAFLRSLSKEDCCFRYSDTCSNIQVRDRNMDRMELTKITDIFDNNIEISHRQRFSDLPSPLMNLATKL